MIDFGFSRLVMLLGLVHHRRLGRKLLFIVAVWAFYRNRVGGFIGLRGHIHKLEGVGRIRLDRHIDGVGPRVVR